MNADDDKLRAPSGALVVDASGFDFDAAVTAPFRMQPGLRRAAAGQAALHDLDPRGAVFAEKLAVLDTDAANALLCAPGFDAEPALRAFVAQAQNLGARHLHADVNGTTALSIGWRVEHGGALVAQRDAHAAAGRCLAALSPSMRLAGLLALALHEDLAIVDGEAATLPWLAVCLPSHWSPAEKIGRSFAEVHGPVPDNATLVTAARHLCRLVCEPQRWERFVWNITPNPQHDQHPRRIGPRSPWRPDDVIAQAHWRTEHQSFVPLTALRQAVFAIHVEVEPLTHAIATPQRAARLHEALASMSEAVFAYRGLEAARASLLTWLASQAAR